MEVGIAELRICQKEWPKWLEGSSDEVSDTPGEAVVVLTLTLTLTLSLIVGRGYGEAVRIIDNDDTSLAQYGERETYA